jgi:hypothetical protein
MESTDTKQARSEHLGALARAFPWPATRPEVELPREHLGWLDEGVRRLLAGALSGETRLVVELGAWLGLSTRWLADHAPGATVVTIDHWRGSPEHHARPAWRALLPTLYETFLAMCWPYRDRVIPLRLTTLAGLQVVADYRLCPDLVYVDAEHSYQAVLSELELAGRLFPTAALVGDDYPHPPVRAAVDDFARRHGLAIRADGNGWSLVGQPQADPGGGRDDGEGR